jgi:small subunit ribosomal protein S1
VDLGGVDGLLHVSELAWRYVKHPDEVLGVDDSVEVYVLSVDRERERISLSRRRLLPDPWFAVTESLRPGQVVEGTVTKIVDFGAFVDLGQGIEGLVHISEMHEGMTADLSVVPDSPIKVRVLGVDDRRRRISLSLRQIEDVALLSAERPLDGDLQRPYLQETLPLVEEPAQ